MRRSVTAVLIGALLAGGCSLLPIGRHRAAVNGIEISYLVYGHGPPLLLMHGGGGRALSLPRQIWDFGRSYRVIAPDARSHGASTDPGDTLSYHVMAEDMIALLDHVRVGRADIVGWSDGAIVGLDLALHHPDRVRKLVLFGANFTPDGVNPATLTWLRAASAADSAARAHDSLEPPSLAVRLRHLWLTQPHFTPAELRSIRTPTLVAVGDHDWPSIEHTIELSRAIRGAQLCVIPGSSHAVLRERADIANEIVLQFLREPMPPERSPRQM
jgi:pimeloyl-ACP methyl ester carboxylesterase